MLELRQSTASQEVLLPRMLDSTDGNTEETGLTIANTDIKLHKHGATTLANKNSGGATHISNGLYYAVLDATDTDTVGNLVIECHPSGALAVRVECQVLPAAEFDAKYTGTVRAANTTQIEGTDATDYFGVTLVNAIAAALTALTVSSTAQGGGSTYITLAAGSSAVNDFYNGRIVVVVGGTGAGQARVISDYTGASKQADVSPAWAVNPDNTSVYIIIGQ